MAEMVPQAAGAIRPLVSTVIAASSDGFLDHSLERVKYRASEMPQGFTYKVISQAYQRCTDHDLDFGTECLHLALQYCGTNAKLIEGPPNLWKVTYRRDLAAAESIIKDSLSRSLCAVTGSCSLAVALARSLQNALEMYMGVDIVPDLLGDHCSHLQKTCNFILISVSHCSLSDVKSFLLALEEACSALLYPLVIFWVWSSGVHVTQPGAFRDLACLYKHKNILLYGIQLQHNKDPEIWGRSVLQLADIISALIRDRTSALVGQIFQA
uniref:D-ribitol-5-phosphate cytidylyltransferase C-terminal domain-containing protein n=1 Tax=Knipowitschia caucasica TaxID=637954 RepID=A0AAV2MGJ5_KNICA